jgi:hypothetical protein
MLMPLGLPPADPGFELFAASNGMSQGLLQTDGPQVIPRVTLRFGALQVGAQWRNITSPVASGIAAFFVKWSRKLGRTQVEMALFDRYRTGAKGPVDRQAWEVDAAVRHSLGRLGLRVIAEYSPKEFEAGPSLYLEGGPNIHVTKAASLSVNVGRRERAGAPDYTTFNAGVTQVLGKVSLDVRLYGTNHSERSTRYQRRLIVSARVTL